MDKDERRRMDQGARLAAARAKAGYRSARAAAIDLGWPESSYRAHENGTRTIGQDDADRYAAAFRAKGVDVTGQTILYAGATVEVPGISVKASPVAPIIRPEGPEESETRPAPNAPRFSDFGDFDVEVRGVTIGGEDDDFRFDGNVQELIRRPPGLLRAKGVFALQISNDSMSPRYEPGEIVFVQERSPIVGDHVIVELYHPDDPDQPGKSFVKKLVRRTGRRIYCTQYNPPKDVEFDAGEVKAIYRVFPNRELFG
jgi:phage repressor protein C with HTH and peptisase S24 domain